LSDLKPGDRVHIKSNWNFPNDCTGVIAEAPEAVRGLVEDEDPSRHWRGHLRSMRGRSRILTFVWIWFDEPQKDGDGDGPYRGGEVELEYVTRIEPT
jgi:hypothetical protein